MFYSNPIKTLHPKQKKQGGSPWATLILNSMIVVEVLFCVQLFFGDEINWNQIEINSKSIEILLQHFIQNRDYANFHIVQAPKNVFFGEGPH